MRLGMIEALEVHRADGHHGQTEHGVGGQHDVGAETGGEGAQHQRADDGQDEPVATGGPRAPAHGGQPPSQEHTDHGHEAEPDGRCLAGRAPPPRTLERSALAQALDDDLEAVARERALRQRSTPRDQGVHAGTLTRTSLGRAADRAWATAAGGDYFLAAS